MEEILEELKSLTPEEKEALVNDPRFDELMKMIDDALNLEKNS